MEWGLKPTPFRFTLNGLTAAPLEAKLVCLPGRRYKKPSLLFHCPYSPNQTTLSTIHYYTDTDLGRLALLLPPCRSTSCPTSIRKSTSREASCQQVGEAQHLALPNKILLCKRLEIRTKIIMENALLFIFTGHLFSSIRESSRNKG